MPNVSSGFKRIAHRGASAEAPENTVPAIRAAVEKYRVDMVEVDLRLTKEGVPVLFHDPTLERTTDGQGRVSSYSLAELKQFDAAYRFDPKGNGEFPFRGQGVKIPTLEEVLREFPDAAFCLEIKEKKIPIVQRVLEVIARIPRKNGILAGSSYGEIRRELTRLAPLAVEILLSEADVARAYTLFRLGFKSYSPPSPYASIPASKYSLRLDDPRWIEFLHRSGVRIFYWTENEVTRMGELLKRGADGIVTDYPDRLNQLLGK